MKNLLGSILSFIFLGYGQAQPNWTDEWVVMVSKLNMREAPSVSSTILTTLEWGNVVFQTTVDSLEEQACDTINNIAGCWMKVQHQNYTGYVFSPYLRQSYMLTYEDTYVEEIPNYRFWYGVYADSSKGTESIRRIKPRLVDEEFHMGDHQHKILKTDQAAISLFIIGTFDSIPEKEMGLYGNTLRKQNMCSEYLKPGNTDYLYVSARNHYITSEIYTLYTTGSCTYNGSDIVVSELDFFVVGTSQYSKQKVVQNLKQYFGYKEVYMLEYAGDIDGDNRPDLILSGSSNSGGITILFLSSRANDGELLRPVTGYEAIDEC